MHWIHCNVCAALPSKSPDVVFYIGSCGHPICEKCLPENGVMSLRSQRDVSGQCRVCNKNSSYKPINRDLPRTIQIFFQSPSTLAEKQCKQLQAVTKFQAEQQTRFYKNVQMKQNMINHQMQCLVKRTQVDAKTIEQKNREIEALRQHTSELEQRLKKEMQENKSARETLVKHMSQSDRSSSRPYPSLNGPTPMSTVSFENVVSSTPLQRNTNIFPSDDDRHRRSGTDMGMGVGDSFQIDFNQFESPLAGAPDFFKTPSSSTLKMSTSKTPASMMFGSGGVDFLR